MGFNRRKMEDQRLDFKGIDPPLQDLSAASFLIRTRLATHSNSFELDGNMDNDDYETRVKNNVHGQTVTIDNQCYRKQFLTSTRSPSSSRCERNSLVLPC